MKHVIKACAMRTACAINRPEVRHSVHYECGLYKSPDARTPIASMNIHNDVALPLIRLLAVVGAIALTVLAIKSALQAMCRKKTCSDKNC